MLAGTLVGFGFITKMLQAFLIIPALAIVYLLAAPTGWWRRVWQVVVMGVATLVAAGWWVAAVALTPAADRPYVGGSQNNSILNLIFGYNGFGRLTGSESGSVVGGGGAGTAGQWGPTGLTRLFNASFGNMMSWLLPGALLMGAALLVLTIRARRTDRERAALLLFGGALVGIGLTISLGQGIIHPYYTVALAATAGRPGRHRHHGALAAPLHVGRPGRPGGGAPGHVGLGLRPARPHARAGSRSSASWSWWPGSSALPPSWPSPGCATCPKLAVGLVAGPGPGRRPGGALVLHGRHGGHAPHGCHPFGHTDARRRRWFRGGGGFGPGGGGFGRGGAGGGGGSRGCAAARAREPARATGTGAGAGTGGRFAGGFPGARTGGGAAAGGFPARCGFQEVDSAGEQRGRSRWWLRWRLPQRQQLESCPDQAAPGRRQSLHLGRRHGELELGRGVPARQRRSGDGHRRLQRHRSGAVTVAVREVRGGGKDPLLHRRRRRGWVRDVGGVATTASKITSWVESHFTAKTVDGTTVYDLTDPATAS